MEDSSRAAIFIPLGNEPRKASRLQSPGQRCSAGSPHSRAAHSTYAKVCLPIVPPSTSRIISFERRLVSKCATSICGAISLPAMHRSTMV
ncbi:hypothetical protein NL676_001187 [Syzygium grande]|nr:hypothetical protein NL676_001187 [Syzygium grande]